MGLFLGFLSAGLVSATALTATGQATKPAGTQPAAGAGAKDAGAGGTGATATGAGGAGAKDAGAGGATGAGGAGGGAARDGGAATTSAGGVGAPAGSGAPVAGGPAVPIPEKPAMDGATYAVRLRDLEARVDELKDQIRRSHTRLALLSDTILSGGAAGSRAEILFRNEMSSAFRLTRALVIVDGAVQYNRSDDTGALADQKEIPIFSGSIPPGDHTVQMRINLRGNGYGVFTYLRGYNFEVTSAHSFTAVEGKSLQVIGTALEKGGVTTPLEQRPQLQWEEKIGALGGGGSSQPAAGGAPAVKTQGQTGNGSASGSVQIGGGK